jgi:hypothetical protein
MRQRYSRCARQQQHRNMIVRADPGAANSNRTRIFLGVRHQFGNIFL